MLCSAALPQHALSGPTTRRPRFTIRAIERLKESARFLDACRASNTPGTRGAGLYSVHSSKFTFFYSSASRNRSCYLATWTCGSSTCYTSKFRTKAKHELASSPLGAGVALNLANSACTSSERRLLAYLGQDSRSVFERRLQTEVPRGISRPLGILGARQGWGRIATVAPPHFW